MKQIIRRIAALVIGLGLGATALAGLESVTHISDLNSAWPLGSDLASTSDDHIRNIKVALKTDFPNVNAAVTPTPAQFNQLTSNAFTSAITVAGNITTSGGGVVRANGTTGAITMRLQNAGTDKSFFCLSISAGACTIGDSANDVTLDSVGGTLYLGANSGASKQFAITNAGAIQAAGPVAGALVDMTPDTGTFTGTFTGFTTVVTGTCTWTRVGKLVTLAFPANSVVTGASNASGFTMTGLPAAIQPATLTQLISLPTAGIQNNGTLGNGGVQVTAGSGTLTFLYTSALTVSLNATFVISGSKGFNTAYTGVYTISYLLN